MCRIQDSESNMADRVPNMANQVLNYQLIKTDLVLKGFVVFRFVVLKRANPIEQEKSKTSAKAS